MYALFPWQLGKPMLMIMWYDQKPWEILNGPCLLIISIIILSAADKNQPWISSSTQEITFALYTTSHKREMQHYLNYIHEHYCTAVTVLLPELNHMCVYSQKSLLWTILIQVIVTVEGYRRISANTYHPRRETFSRVCGKSSGLWFNLQLKLWM